jgi:hypothetical protein
MFGRFKHAKIHFGDCYVAFVRLVEEKNSRKYQMKLLRTKDVIELHTFRRYANKYVLREASLAAVNHT